MFKCKIVVLLVTTSRFMTLTRPTVNIGSQRKFRNTRLEILISKVFKFECDKCYCLLTYQKQPHNCPDGDENEGFVCDLELHSMDLYYKEEQKLDDGFFDTV